MNKNIKINHYKVLQLPISCDPNSIYYVLDSERNKVKTYITDSNGIPIPLIDLKGEGVIESVTGTAVTGTITNPEINIVNLLSSELGNLVKLSSVDGKLKVNRITSPDLSLEIVNATNELQLQLASELLEKINNALQPEDITQYTDEDAQDAVGNILVDSNTVDLVYNDITPQISASVKQNSITNNELSSSVNNSLNLANTSLQPVAIQNFFDKLVDDTDDIVEGTIKKFTTISEKNFWNLKQEELTEDNVGEFMNLVIPTKLTPSSNDTLLARDFLTNKAVEIEVGKFQEKLLSGTNIKTVNGNSLLGLGNLEVKDYIEVDSYSVLISTVGVSEKIYLTRDDNKLYRFNGTIYVPLGASITGLTTDILPYWNGSNLADSKIKNIRLNSDFPTNLFLGDGAGINNTPISDTQGRQNGFLGVNAGRDNTTGYANLFLGYNAGYQNTTGTRNTFLGYQAGFRGLDTNYNTFIGTDAGYRNAADNNIFIGFHVGFDAANPVNITGDKNIIFGNETANSLTTGYSNNIMGHNAGFGITTGHSNILHGYNSGLGITSGNQNVLIGVETGQALTTGTNNVYLGFRAGFFANNSTFYNTGVGDQSFFNLTTGNLNTGVGGRSGLSLLTGQYNTFIGFDSGNNALQKTDALFSTAIGYNSYNTANNQVVIGGDNVTETLIRGNVPNLALTGTPTAPTATAGTANTQIANTLFVNNSVRSREGWASYSTTTYTNASPFTVAPNSTVTLLNNANNSIIADLPLGVTAFYNGTTNKITPVAIGDSYTVNVRFKARTTMNNDYLSLFIDIGAGTQINAEAKQFLKGANTEQPFSFTMPIFTLATFVANGGEIKLSSNGGTISVYDITYFIIRNYTR